MTEDGQLIYAQSWEWPYRNNCKRSLYSVYAQISAKIVIVCVSACWHYHLTQSRATHRYRCSVVLVENWILKMTTGTWGATCLLYKYLTKHIHQKSWWKCSCCLVLTTQWMPAHFQTNILWRCRLRPTPDTFPVASHLSGIKQVQTTMIQETVMITSKCLGKDKLIGFKISGGLTMSICDLQKCTRTAKNPSQIGNVWMKAIPVIPQPSKHTPTHTRNSISVRKRS